ECGRDPDRKVVAYSLKSDIPRVLEVPKFGSAVSLWYDLRGNLVLYGVKVRNGVFEQAGWIEIHPGDPKAIRKLDFPRPANSYFLMPQLSPAGDYALWTIMLRDSRPMWLTRLLSMFVKAQKKVPPVSGQAVYVSRRDGSQMREIGRMRIHSSHDNAFGFGWDRTGDNICF